MRPVAPSQNKIAVDTPPRLSIIPAAAFPIGSIMVSGLGREAARGRLMIGLQEGSRQRDRGCPCLRGERICDNGRQKQGGED
jgi:hypothetical protein